jgi:hypothetical protein
MYGTEYLLKVKTLGVTAPFTVSVVLTASTPTISPLTPTTSLERWFDPNHEVTIGVSTPNEIGHGEWAIFKEYTGDASGQSLAVSLVMTGPKMVNAVFFPVNPVAMSIPFSIVGGIVSVILCYAYVRSRKQEESNPQVSEENKSQRNSGRIILGVLVGAVVLVVAAIVSSNVAIGYGIDTGKLLDFTNWAVLFTGLETLVFLVAAMLLSRRKAERINTLANPYGI